MGSVAHLEVASAALGRAGLNRMLHATRRRAAWAPGPIPRARLDELHTLMSLGPAMVDASPTQLLFLTSDKAKARLTTFLPEAAKTQAALAPACALIGYDVDFAEQLAEFLPCAPTGTSVDPSAAARQTAIRNGALQGAYLIVAARALGLEATVIPDFDTAGASFEFFRRMRVRATFLCALGYPAEGFA
ncbi:MAG: nitroreductase family protein [Proteobacteria bacterium]|nr:nitroreductase family protein [Pseudomonadota bacterium]